MSLDIELENSQTRTRNDICVKENHKDTISFYARVIMTGQCVMGRIAHSCVNHS